MTNKQIARVFKEYAQVLEILGENEFKYKALYAAAYSLERHPAQLSTLSEEELVIQWQMTKGVAAKVIEIVQTGTMQELQSTLQKIPNGLLQLLDVKGLGPKKISQLWKELHITNLELLKEACLSGKIHEIKGFGEKIREEILEYFDFQESIKGFVYYADAEIYAKVIEEHLSAAFPDAVIKICGQVERKLELIDKIEILVSLVDMDSLIKETAKVPFLQTIHAQCGPFSYTGYIADADLRVKIYQVDLKDFGRKQYVLNASPAHLQINLPNENTTLGRIIYTQSEANEQEVAKAAGIAFIPSECREGYVEEKFFQNQEPLSLLQQKDIKGPIHNHTQYSDGQHTLEQMALEAIRLGYEYVGISDHSKTATYAQGLEWDRVLVQHKEIEALNQKLAPFVIFKGIESDILSDGSLDYDPQQLQSFDFVVASIHSGLKMTKEEATQRLVKAIENPYTTILGHPSGRLLLKRAPYPVDYDKVLDACAANNVCIEINADPWRLDLDWRYVHKAIDKGIYISINPDAHDTEGYSSVRFGVLVGRKAGLTAANTLNAKSVDALKSYFQTRKDHITKAFPG